MIIAVDEAIPYGQEAFSGIGEIRLFSGRNLRPEGIRNADALVVRTVTNINASILEGSSIRFVASASAGIDHIDREYLKTRGIHFAYAAGSNAESVSEYIMAVLHVVASRRNWNLRNKSLAVVGVGNVGSRVEKKARALGMEVLLCDPPLRDSTGNTKYQDLEEILGADILTFHVPLAMEGPYPTWHMIDHKALNRLSRNQFLINSARGAVFDNAALKTALTKVRIEGAVLDVWEGEPHIDYSLLDQVDIGTPHIAGFSLDGKVRATEMVCEELCKFFERQPSWNAQPVYPESRRVRPKKGASGQKAVLSVLLQAFDIMNDDASLRALRSMDSKQAAIRFDQLRSEYDYRPEFRHFMVELSQEHKSLANTLSDLGFAVEIRLPASNVNKNLQNVTKRISGHRDKSAEKSDPHR